jgi:hypothetical protein
MAHRLWFVALEWTPGVGPVHPHERGLCFALKFSIRPVQIVILITASLSVFRTQQPGSLNPPELSESWFQMRSSTSTSTLRHGMEKLSNSAYVEGECLPIEPLNRTLSDGTEVFPRLPSRQGHTIPAQQIADVPLRNRPHRRRLLAHILVE